MMVSSSQPNTVPAFATVISAIFVAGRSRESEGRLRRVADPERDRVRHFDDFGGELGQHGVRQSLDGACNAHGRDDVTAAVANRRCNRAHADFALLVLEGVALLANLLKYFPKLLWARVCLRRSRLQPVRN